ncbi:E3 ubiquitin-protein ligase TRIM17 [Varanus komodoensis]|nr:E3 ubiquitin-protein ligase TRIM17 [Varanus komodoensis]
MENPVESLHKEATCSICLEYFRDPVSIPCGHSFCRTCITQCWKERNTNFSCPQCREVALQRNFRPNRELGNVVEITKRLSLHAFQEGEDGEVCEKHGEALKLFCSEEESLICCICRESRAHRTHRVFPVEEAAQDYKVTLAWGAAGQKEGRTRAAVERNGVNAGGALRDPGRPPGHVRDIREQYFRTEALAMS